MSILSDTKIDVKPEALGKSDTYDLLKEDTPPKEEEIKEEKNEKEEKPEEEKEDEEIEKEDTEVDEEEEEIDELAEIENELEEPEEDELEVVTPVRRAEILKKYPKIFKDFPYLEKAYYRERKYSEIFPNPGDAKVAQEKAETLSNFEQELLGGDLTKILDSVKKENGESFNKIADNYLLSLSKVDEKAYHHVIGRIIRSTIHNMVLGSEELGEDGGKVLKNAAAILNQFVFGTAKFTKDTPLAKEEVKSDRERDLEARETRYKEQRFTEARDGLENRIDNVLKNTIANHIDPKKSMTDYIRRVAEKDAIDTVYKLMVKDTRFAVLRDKLWQNAEKNNYDSESLDRIRSAYLSRAKTLLEPAIKKARQEALKGMGKRVKEESEEDNTEETPKERKSSAPKREDKPRIKPGQIPPGMSNKDFIMSD